MASNSGKKPPLGESESAAPTQVAQGQPSTSTANANPQTQPSGSKRRRRKRKAKQRRESFAPPPEISASENVRPGREQRAPMYRLGQSNAANLSDTSLASEALLDHRDQPHARPRRDSRVPFPVPDVAASYQARPIITKSESTSNPKSRYARAHASSGGESDDDGNNAHDARTPLLGVRDRQGGSGYGISKATSKASGKKSRSASAATSASSRRPPIVSQDRSFNGGYDVNNPPSVPNSPKFNADSGLDDVMVADPFLLSPSERRKSEPNLTDHLIDIDGDEAIDDYDATTPTAMQHITPDMRRHTLANPAEGDVCFPVEGMSEIGAEDYARSEVQRGSRRKRIREWPDLSILDEWSREEKEERSEGIRAKKISEPVLVGGRLRPLKTPWHREEAEAPYRYTYFNEDFPSTIHSQTISELQQPGQSFRELFIPDPPELSDYTSDEDDLYSYAGTADRRELSPRGDSVAGTRHSSIMGDVKLSTKQSSGEATPLNMQQQQPQLQQLQPLSEETQQPEVERPKRYGARPLFWLDVLSPTEAEMRVIQKAFGIHPLTAEDIMMQEAREKVELFRNYYLVSYRTFEQDTHSVDYLDPVNIYVCVFRDGVISFHFSQTPHPANVRRRIRQLQDHMRITPDWISYAIIDDITDVFAPVIQAIETEVDEIDDAILKLHHYDESGKSKADSNDEKRSDNGSTIAESGGDMLRRVGEGRKQVMRLYRLIGNKADVIKGFAKRCNEQWENAPRSDIGLYLGDIQDHILTMTSNLGHYETLLSRAHSNYLAQINIRMNERQEQTADVLGKLTVLGTIVLPMNIITGMWGMNVLVPGQDVDNLWWFWSITAGLVLFGVSCFFIAKRVYGIV